MGASEEMAAAIAAAAALEPGEAAPDVTEADEPDVAEAEAEADEPEAEEATPEEPAAEAVDTAAIGQMILDGDLDSACKALNIDKKALAVNPAKFEAMRKGLRSAKELEAAAEKKTQDAAAATARAEAIVADARKQYGPLIDLKLALKAKDFSAARDLLEALAPDGVTYKEIAEGLAASARAGGSPSELAYKRKLRELEEKARKDAEEKAAQDTKEAEAREEAARVERNRAGATKLLKGTPFEGIPGAEDALIKLAASNWDPVKKGLRVAPTELVRQLGKDPLVGAAAELRRIKRGKPATAPVVPPAAPRVPVVQRKLLTRKEQEAAELKAAIAEAAKQEQAAARAARRGVR